MEKLAELVPHVSTNTMWVIFGIAVIVLLAWDLFFLNRKNEVPVFSHTLWLCVIYIAAGLLFGLFVMIEQGTEKIIINFLKSGDDAEIIAKKAEIPLEKVLEIKEKHEL